MKIITSHLIEKALLFPGKINYLMISKFVIAYDVNATG